MQATLAAPSLFTGDRYLSEVAHQRATTPEAQPLAEMLDSRELLQGRKAVTIMHNGAMYRLQATKLGKLILTK
jgi:hemin uptake protein HemP